MRELRALHSRSETIAMNVIHEVHNIGIKMLSVSLEQLIPFC